ncbi:methylenetetrahydrofolate reductase [Breoghania sp.]|uniref:methylenetetrahydrofolate reductase n=1 Tax=Breoghania sp. TaxID=2065378 RepID=UPI0029C9B9F0|nr:methylenetetrahydrofolate reductase [Breoghania sp.]
MSEIRAETVVRASNASGPERTPLWLRGWSMEAVLPDAATVQTVGGILAPGTDVYLSAIARVPDKDQLASAAALRDAGLSPVLHLAARKFSCEQELADMLGEAESRAGVRNCLVVAGDISAARGPFASSLDLISSAAFAGSNIERVGLAGYPEGHPFVDDSQRSLLLAEKVLAARGSGKEPYVVSQFCFDATRILHWLSWLRTLEPKLSVRLGIAGPANAASLMKLSLRCGVDTPSAGNRQTPPSFHSAGPDRVISDLEAGLKSLHERGPLQLHIYSFGAFERTARWARAAQSTTEFAHAL